MYNGIKTVTWLFLLVCNFLHDMLFYKQAMMSKFWHDKFGKRCARCNFQTWVRVLIKSHGQFDEIVDQLYLWKGFFNVSSKFSLCQLYQDVHIYHAVKVIVVSAYAYASNFKLKIVIIFLSKFQKYNQCADPSFHDM